MREKSGEDLMENMIEIADSQRGLLWILFAVLVLAVFFGICIEEKENIESRKFSGGRETVLPDLCRKCTELLYLS